MSNVGSKRIDQLNTTWQMECKPLRMEVGQPDQMSSESCREKNQQSRQARGYCETARQLLNKFGEAVRALVLLHEQQFHAIMDGDPDAGRFDVLIHHANEVKQNAKYAYLNHIHVHGCSTYDGDIDT